MIYYLLALFVGDGVNFGLDASFVDTQNWNLIREKAEKVNIAKVYIKKL